MGIYEDFFNRASNFNQKENKIEYYEDTHDEFGNYIQSNNKQKRFVDDHQDEKSSQDYQEHEIDEIYSKQYTPIYNTFKDDRYAKKKKSMPLPNVRNQEIVRRNYNNVVIYEPKEPEDVQALIDYLKRKEPAVVNLDKLDEFRSQRILDFISGAIYALNGSVHRISGNIFLISPEGVEVTVPFDPNKN